MLVFSKDVLQLLVLTFFGSFQDPSDSVKERSRAAKRLPGALKGNLSPVSSHFCLVLGRVNGCPRGSEMKVQKRAKRKRGNP